jgi:hypothetical protein
MSSGTNNGWADNTLPIDLSEYVAEKSKDPVASGGFADIYLGKLDFGTSSWNLITNKSSHRFRNSQTVAIKVTRRLFDREKVERVSADLDRDLTYFQLTIVPETRAGDSSRASTSSRKFTSFSWSFIQLSRSGSIQSYTTSTSISLARKW